MKKYITKQSSIKGAGKGLFTNASFKKGDVIGLAHVDDQPASEIGRNHNHNEKNPTAYSKKIDNKRFIYASKNLKPGEEITTNYRMQPELEQPEDFMRKGGSVLRLPNKKNSKGYSRSLSATNKLFTQNFLFAKPKSRKNKVFDPNSKYYAEGGALLTKEVTCKKCGWKWDAEDGGKDITTCHECGGQGLIHAQKGGNKDTMTGMMKARLAYANEFGNPAAERMINLPDNPYQFDNGDTGSHYMASMDNYAVPQIQDENGVLQLGDYGPESNEAIRFDSDEDANYFAENYKDVSPGFIEADLDEDEIEEYRKGGYIVEEIDNYQKGGTYTVKGSDGVYKKVNGKWQVDWNKSGKYQPLSKGNVKARTAVLNKMAKPLYDKDYDEMVAYKNLSAEDKINKFIPKKEVTKEELKKVSERLGRNYKPVDTKLQSVNMVYPEKYLIGPGTGAIGLGSTIARNAAGLGIKGLNKAISYIPAPVLGALNASMLYEGAKNYSDPNSYVRKSTSRAINNPTFSNVKDAAFDNSMELLNFTTLPFNKAFKGLKKYSKPIVKYANNKYTNIAEGSNMFDYAWKSPAARFDKNVKTYDNVGNIILPEMPQSKAIFDKLKTNPNLTAEELAIIKDYEATSINYKTGSNKEKLDAIIKKSGLTVNKPTVMSRRIDASNADNFNPVNGIFNTKRPTSWSAGRDAVGNEAYSGSADRMVMKLQPGEYDMLKNPYLENSPETLDALTKMYEPMGSLEHRMQFVTGKPRIDEREILLGSGTDLKQIGKVKNNFGGFDYIMKNLNKKQDGGATNNYIELDLTPEEIKDLIAQGYVIEELN
jgi:hypothetical protein